MLFIPCFRGTFSIVALSLALASCGTRRASESSPLGYSPETKEKPASSCSFLDDRYSSLVIAYGNMCLSGEYYATSQTLLWLSGKMVSALNGGKEYPPFMVLQVSNATGCLVAKDIGALRELLKANCNAAKAEKMRLEFGVDACTRLNNIPASKRKAKLPDWCPQRESGQRLCIVKEGYAPCMVFGSSKVVIDAVKEFQGGVATSMTWHGQTNIYHSTTIARTKCYVPASQVTCSQ